MAANGLRTLWRNGGTAYGAFIFTRLDPVVVEALGKVGYDYVCIDLQHGLMEFGEMVVMLQALAIGNTTPIVRVPANDPAIIGRVLDAGALGVIIPMVNSSAEAAQAVSACRYAPTGTRSFGPVRAGISYGSNYVTDAKELVICIPMIETAEAVRVAPEIVAVPGVDAVYIGPADLSLTLDLPPALDNSGEFSKSLADVTTASLERGVIAGIHANVALAGRRRNEGFRMITIATDISILNLGFEAELRNSRSSDKLPGQSLQGLL